MAPLRIKQHGINAIRVALPFEPMAFDAACQIGAGKRLDHQPFDHIVGRRGAQGGKVVPVVEAQERRAVDPLGQVKAIEQRAPLRKGLIARRMAGQHRGGHALAVQPLLQLAKGRDLIATPHQQFPIQHPVEVQERQHVREGCADILARARIKPPCAAVIHGLHADAVPFACTRMPSHFHSAA